MNIQQETNSLDAIADKSLYTTFSNQMMIEYCFSVFKRHLKAGSILELGPAEGVMSKFLYEFSQNITFVDGSSIFCKDLRKRFPEATVVETLFEQYEPEQQFDNIILGHVLEHVNDPVEILKLAKGWLKEDGVILSAVPNSRSIHRQAAVVMKLLKTEDSMSKLDYHHGHRRIYNPESFRNDFLAADLEIIHYGGYWLKPISNAQIHDTWNKEMLDAFMKIGERYPDIAAEIYVIATN